MKTAKTLIIDDEKNTRLTLGQCLEREGIETVSAVNAEEGLEKLKEEDFGVIFLDLRMPGMGGMEFLKKVREIRPDIKIIVISAYGTVDLAVEAMKEGAVEFLQKPFTPKEVRRVMEKLSDPDAADRQTVDDYEKLLDLARQRFAESQFEAAREHLKSALGTDPDRPEAFNLLGLISEAQRDKPAALQNYRTALEKDATYKPAEKNLYRATGGEDEDSLGLEAYRPGSGGGKEE